MTKSFVPKLLPGRLDIKPDQDRPDKRHPPKVCSGNLLPWLTVVCNIS